MKRWLVPMLFLLAGCADASPVNQFAPAVELHGQRFSVEFATDGPSREHGLMMRTTLAAHHGMLFVFPEADPQAFWMKNTLIPLDILFFDAQGKVLSTATMTPCTADPCKIYSSKVEATMALEVPAGFIQSNGIKASWKLER